MAITRISQSSVKEGLEKYTSFYGGASGFAFGSLESIATVSVGVAGASSIVFSSIPSDYQNLQLRCLFRIDQALYFTVNNVRFNSDSSSNYTRHVIFADSVFTGAGGIASMALSTTATVGSSAISNNYALNIVDIYDYSNTSKNTTLRVFNGFDNNGLGPNNNDKGVSGIAGASWMNTNVVNSIQILAPSGIFVQHSTVALYGIRA